MYCCYFGSKKAARSPGGVAGNFRVSKTNTYFKKQSNQRKAKCIQINKDTLKTDYLGGTKLPSHLFLEATSALLGCVEGTALQLANLPMNALLKTSAMLELAILFLSILTTRSFTALHIDGVISHSFVLQFNCILQFTGV